GAVVEGFPGSSATGSSVFVGLANNGGSRASGFRTNAGAYNPYPLTAHVTFSLYRNTGKLEAASLLGEKGESWGPNEAKQINDVFAYVGASSQVTTDAILLIYSDIPLYSYVTVIDNVTGDSIVEGPTSF